MAQNHNRDSRFTAAPDGGVEILSRQVGPTSRPDGSKSMNISDSLIDGEHFLPSANQLPPDWELESC